MSATLVKLLFIALAVLPNLVVLGAPVNGNTLADRLKTATTKGANKNGNTAAATVTTTTAKDGSIIVDQTVTINGLAMRFKVSGPKEAFKANITAAATTGNTTTKATTKKTATKMSHGNAAASNTTSTASNTTTTATGKTTVQTGNSTTSATGNTTTSAAANSTTTAASNTTTSAAANATTTAASNSTTSAASNSTTSAAGKTTASASATANATTTATSTATTSASNATATATGNTTSTATGNTTTTATSNSTSTSNTTSTTNLGINVLFHGDGGQSFLDFPNQGVQNGLMGVAILSPDPNRRWGGGSGLNRPDGAAHSAAVNELITNVLPTIMNFDKNQIFLEGVSGGSLMLGGFTIPQFAASLGVKGAVLGCGGLPPQVAVQGNLTNLRLHFQSTQNEQTVLKTAIPATVTAYQNLVADITADASPNGGHCAFDQRNFVSGVQLLTNNFASIMNGNATLNGVQITNKVTNAKTLFATGNAKAATGATTAATGRGGKGRNATANQTNRNRK